MEAMLKSAGKDQHEPGGFGIHEPSLGRKNGCVRSCKPTRAYTRIDQVVSVIEEQ